MLKKIQFHIIRKCVYAATIISLVLIIVFVALHFSTFHKRLSTNLNDWSDFGSFFSGTIGVILSGLNFIILAYLTFKVNRNHDQQWLTELRAPFYKDIIEKTYSLTDEKLSNPEAIDLYIQWLKNTDFKNLLFLIDPKEEYHLNQLKIKFITTLQNLKTHGSFKMKDDGKTIAYVIEAKTNFTRFLGDIMMDQTSKHLNHVHKKIS